MALPGDHDISFLRLPSSASDAVRGKQAAHRQPSSLGVDREPAPELGTGAALGGGYAGAPSAAARGVPDPSLGSLVEESESAFKAFLSRDVNRLTRKLPGVHLPLPPPPAALVEAARKAPDEDVPRGKVCQRSHYPPLHGAGQVSLRV